MKLGYFEILKLASEQKTTEQKIEVLRKHGTAELCSLINLAYDPNVKWLLPEGNPPYTPNPYPDQENRFQSEIRRMYLFVSIPGVGDPNMTQLKREKLFVELLETIHPEDAKLLLAVKSGKVPYKGLTRALFAKAWPGRVVAGKTNDTEEEIV